MTELQSSAEASPSSKPSVVPAQEIHSLLAARNTHSQQPITGQRNVNTALWEKGSFGVSGSVAGLTSEGKNLTDGLDYSSSVFDLASHNQQVSRDCGNAGSNEDIDSGKKLKSDEL